MLILTTLWLFVIFAMASLSVDAGDWYYTRFREQKAADAAAIAGAVALSYTSATNASACAAANNAAAQNGFNTAAGSPNTSTACSSTGNGFTVTVTPNTGAKTASATVSETGQSFFSVAFGLIHAAPTIAAAATAAVAQQSSSQVCILGLSGSVVVQLLNLTIRNCTLASNATTVNAIQLSLAQLSFIQSLYSAGGICMVGTPSCQPNLLGELTTATGIQALLNDLLLNFQIPPKEFQLPIANPFAPLNTASFTVATAKSPSITGLNIPLLGISINVNATYFPGTYASTLATNALTVTFEPGTYVLKNGLDIEGPGVNTLTSSVLKTLGLSPNVAVTGSGVTFVVSGGTAKIGANALGLGAGLSLITNLSAPAVNTTSNALNGVLFDIPSSTTQLNLGSVANVSLGSLGSEGLQGAVYAPKAPVSLGLASINLALFNNPCLVVVGQSVTLPITQAALNLTFNPTACASDGVQLPHPQFVELTQ